MSHPESQQSENPTRILQPLPEEVDPREDSLEGKQKESPQAYMYDEEYTEERELHDYSASARAQDYLYEDINPAQRYHRLQIIPCIIGWLVSYGVLSIGTTASRSILEGLGAQHLGSAGNLIPALESTPIDQATPWLLALGITLFTAYALAGYSAARLARYSAFKQALGVVAISFFASTAASIYTFLTKPEGFPFISFQYLSGESISTGLIGILAYFALALLASAFGALFGKRFESMHRKFS